KVSELTNFVQQLGIDCSSLQDRFEVKKVIEESEGMPEQHAIHFAVLRSMQKAVYSPEEIGHYALNSNNYCHFTSPIRRYPDLIIHRMVGDLVDGKQPDANFDRLAMLGKHCSELEKRAADAERDLIKLKLLNFLVDKIGTRMHAVITGVESFGVFAQGVDIPAEGLIPISNLPPDTYQYDRAGRILTGFRAGNEFRLGDQIEIEVSHVDPDKRELEFKLVANDSTQTRDVSPRKKSQNPTGSIETPKETGVKRKSKEQTDWERRRASGPQKGHKKKKKRKRRVRVFADSKEDEGKGNKRGKRKSKSSPSKSRKKSNQKKETGQRKSKSTQGKSSSRNSKAKTKSKTSPGSKKGTQRRSKSNPRLTNTRGRSPK
ncbi:MAG: RNB domain-containing ribonuclease, partial [Planctomycetota bacterium]